MAHTLSFHTGHPKKYRVLTAVRKKNGQSNLPRLLYFQNKKVWIVGDSLMVGWDGTKLLKKNCPKFISQDIHSRVNNDYSFSGAQISGNQQMRTFDLTNNVYKIILDPLYGTCFVDNRGDSVENFNTVGIGENYGREKRHNFEKQIFSVCDRIFFRYVCDGD